MPDGDVAVAEARCDCHLPGDLLDGNLHPKRLVTVISDAEIEIGAERNIGNWLLARIELNSHSWCAGDRDEILVADDDVARNQEQLAVGAAPIIVPVRERRAALFHQHLIGQAVQPQFPGECAA